MVNESGPIIKPDAMAWVTVSKVVSINPKLLAVMVHVWAFVGVMLLFELEPPALGSMVKAVEDVQSHMFPYMSVAVAVYVWI